MSEGKRKIGNKMKRSSVFQKEKQAKAKAKLSRRLQQRKEEAANPALKEERLRTNVPRTVENSRTFVGMDEEGRVTDKRTVPVQFLPPGEDGHVELDLAGLQDLFPDEQKLGQASTSQHTLDTLNEGPILLTTSPKPSQALYAALKELTSLFGGPNFVQTIPRKNARFKLSKISKWAAQRNYSAIAVVGEDHGEPSSLTLTKLPLGPTAHFRLTSFTPTREISGHGNPSDHAPELVLSNMSTPLGLTVGRLLQSLFPPLPELVGRQVVAVHNQRDFIFFRRFRYMFNLRIDGEDADDEERRELLLKRARERGLDETFRARMQEVGPRLTLKLRWIKKGTLEKGRRKASGMTIGKTQSNDADVTAEQAKDLDMLDVEADKDDDPCALEEGESADAPTIEEEGPGASDKTPSDNMPENKENTKKRKRNRSSTHYKAGGDIKIPKLSATMDSLNASNTPGSGGAQRLKGRRQGQSILAGLSFDGGVKDTEKEWVWKPSMQTKKNRFAL